MSTFRQVIEDSLLDLGIGALGEDTEADIVNHGFRMLNRMLESWSSELNPIYASTLDSLTWTSGSEVLTIGSGGDLDTVRPIEITGVQVRVSGVDYTLSPVSYEQYEETPIKDIENNYPTVYAYQKTFPLGKIHIYYVPSDNLPVRIQSKKPLSAAVIDDSISLPSGYELAMQTNLTVLLAAAHGKQPKPETVRFAMNFKAAIEDINQDHAELWPDSMCPGVGGYNVDDLGALTNG